MIPAPAFGHGQEPLGHLLALLETLTHRDSSLLFFLLLLAFFLVKMAL